jgi:5,10-methylenetetrahydromethanopterin reductase
MRISRPPAVPPDQVAYDVTDGAQLALPRVAVRLDGMLPPQDCLRHARMAEAHPFAALWFAENPFARSAVPAAAAAAAATGRLRICVGVVNPFARHPVLLAMEWAALGELSQDRAVLGIGAGIAAALRQMGVAADRPLAAVADAIAIIRRLCRGETVSYRGRVFSVDEVRLDFTPRTPPPIFMAAVGDRGLALCGRIADGLVVSNMLSCNYAARAAAILRQAAANAGRPMPEIVQYLPCAAGPDGAEARRLVKAPLARMLSAFWSRGAEQPHRRSAMVEGSGITAAEFAATVARLGRGEAAELALDDRFVDAFAVAGTADQCLARMAAYRSAGVGELALGFVGPHPEHDLDYLGRALGETLAAGRRT